MCFQERSDKTRSDFDELKFYAIKVVISETFTTYLANAFLTFYNDAYAHFYQTHMDATTQANLDAARVVVRRKRKAEVQALERRRDRVAEDLAKLEAELSAKRARV